MIGVLIVAPIVGAFHGDALHCSLDPCKWATRENGTGNDHDILSGMVASPDGQRLFATGTMQENSPDFGTLALNVVDGQRTWKATFDGEAHQDDGAYGIAIAPDGAKVFVTGYSAGAVDDSTDEDAMTIAYATSNGQQLWSARYEGPANRQDDGLAVTVAPQGDRVYVAGLHSESPLPASEPNYLVLAYAAQTGQALWTATYDGPAGMGDVATHVLVSPTGTTVYVTGSSNTPAGSAFATVAFNATNGNFQWAARYGQHAAPEASTLSPDGSRLYVTGGEGNAYVLLAYDTADGHIIWSVLLDAASGGADLGKALVVGPQGSRVYAAAQAYDPETHNDYVTLAHNATNGAIVWRSVQDGGENLEDRATAIALAPDAGRLYVTGLADSLLDSTNYFTVGLDPAQGAPAWTRTYAGDGQDWAGAVLVDPETVYVGGSSEGVGFFDYVVVAHRITPI